MLGQQPQGGDLGRLVGVGREQGRHECGVGGVAPGELTGDPAATEVLVDEGAQLDGVDQVAVVREREGLVL